jgi:hypothetical protein
MPLLAWVRDADAPRCLEAIWRAVRDLWIEGDRVTLDRVVERDVRELLRDHERALFDDLVRTIIDELAVPIQRAKWPSSSKKCECTRGTEPLQGFAVSAI